MTAELVIAIALILKNDLVIPCERAEIQVGQIACLSKCVEREPTCPGDATIKCDQVDIVHTDAVADVKLP